MQMVKLSRIFASLSGHVVEGRGRSQSGLAISCELFVYFSELKFVVLCPQKQDSSILFYLFSSFNQPNVSLKEDAWLLWAFCPFSKRMHFICQL